ncbi:MAG: hypothetical protein J7L04_00235, partial [Bacteroidales bacterium]|nr:hypothetical protein [Bacteroidales bacterium]
NGLIEFEISIMIALVLIQEYEILRDMLEISFESYNLDNPKFDIFAILSSNPNSLPVIFLEYSKFKLGISNSENFPIMLEKIINNYISIFEDFIYQIMLKWLLCDYFRIAGDIYKANIYYQSALEISQFAQYDFYTAFLMINNPARDPESIQQAERQIGQSGFKLELFKHF